MCVCVCSEHVTRWRAVPRDATHDKISWAEAAAPGGRTSRDGRRRSSIPSFPVTSVRATLHTPPSMCVSCLPAEQHNGTAARSPSRPTPRRPSPTPNASLTPLARWHGGAACIPCAVCRGHTQVGVARPGTLSSNLLACSRGPVTARHLPRAPPACLVTSEAAWVPTLSNHSAILRHGSSSLR